jgi:hypothetical protein
MKIRNPEVMAEFRRRRNRQWAASGFIIAVVLPIMFLTGRSNARLFGLPQNITTGIMFGAVIVVLVFSLTNWRCPECNKYLGKRWNPQFCSHCGVQLHE